MNGNKHINKNTNTSRKSEERRADRSGVGRGEERKGGGRGGRERREEERRGEERTYRKKSEGDYCQQTATSETWVSGRPHLLHWNLQQETSTSQKREYSRIHSNSKVEWRRWEQNRQHTCFTVRRRQEPLLCRLLADTINGNNPTRGYHALDDDARA